MMKRGHGGGGGFPSNLSEICRIGGLPWRAWHRSRIRQGTLGGCWNTASSGMEKVGVLKSSRGRRAVSAWTSQDRGIGWQRLVATLCWHEAKTSPAAGRWAWWLLRGFG